MARQSTQPNQSYNTQGPIENPYMSKPDMEAEAKIRNTQTPQQAVTQTAPISRSSTTPKTTQTAIQTSQPVMQEQYPTRMQQSTGLSSDSKTFTADSPEVQAEMAKYPGLSIDAAIGNVTMRRNQVLQGRTPVAIKDGIVDADYAKQEQQRMMKDIEAEKKQFEEAPDYLADFYAKEEARVADKDANQYLLNPELQKIDQEYADYIAQIEGMRGKMEARNQQTVDNIRRVYTDMREQQKVANASRLKAQEIIGTRSGRQRYAPVIQEGVLSAEEKAGMKRLSDLQAEEEQLVNQAMNAWQDQDFAMVSQIFNTKTELRKEKNAELDRVHKMAIEREQLSIAKMQREKLERDQTLEQLSQLSIMGQGTLSESDATFLDDYLKMPKGFSQAYVDFNLKARQAESQASQMEGAKAYLDMVMKIPEGETVMIPGYGTVTGMKEVDPTKGIMSFTETAADGSTYQNYIQFNPETGEFDLVNSFQSKAPSATLSYENLSAQEKLTAKNLSVELFGMVQGGNKENIALIAEFMRDGYSVSEIKNYLNQSSNAPEFVGAVRDAAGNLFNLGTAEGERFTNELNRKLEEGQSTGDIIEFLKKGARSTVGMEQQKNIEGKERTVEFFGEVMDDLRILQSQGINTNIFQGTEEEVFSKVGKVSQPELRDIASKIATQLMSFRKSMSGVSFSSQEAEQYAKIFPDISKDFNYNEAVAKGVMDSFGGDVRFFYESQLGKRPYQELIGKWEREQATPTSLNPITQSYMNLDSLLGENPAYGGLVYDIGLDLVATDPSLGNDEARLRSIILDQIYDLQGFNQPLSKGQKGSTTISVLPKEKLNTLTTGQTKMSIGDGIITGFGSKYWKDGLDFVVKGGIGAPVKTPMSGVVVDVRSGYSNPKGMTPLAFEEGKKQNSGFGNQVKVKFANGVEMWFSHLKDVGARVGQKIAAGSTIGTQGNTGSTYGKTGVHVDITALKPDGTRFTAREVAALLGDKRLFS